MNNMEDKADHNMKEQAMTGSVRLRGVSVSLDTDVGGAFVIDCGRHTEGLLSDNEIKAKWALSDEDWEGLAANTPLLQAVRAERARRIQNGEAVREAAQLHFAKAPNVLSDILRDEHISPRHRIEAAKELRQTAGNDQNTGPKAGERFVISINLGGDEKLIYDKAVAPSRPTSSDNGEMS